MSPPRPAAFDCPNCGADVPAGALACPECGADDETHSTGNPPAWKPAVYGLAAVVLLVAFFWALSRGGRLW